MNNQRAQNIQELWDNLERCNTCTWNSRRTNEAEETFEVMPSIPKLMTDIKPLFRKQQTPSRTYCTQLQ